MNADSVVVLHADVAPQALSSDPAPAQQPPPADSDPSGIDEQLQLEL